MGFLGLAGTRAVLETGAGNALGGGGTPQPNTPCSCQGQAGAAPDFATRQGKEQQKPRHRPYVLRAAPEPPATALPQPLELPLPIQGMVGISLCPFMLRLPFSCLDVPR